MKKSIREALNAHLSNDGTANDSTTDALYRKAHGINNDEETDLESVERWALENYSAPSGVSA